MCVQLGMFHLLTLIVAMRFIMRTNDFTIVYLARRLLLHICTQLTHDDIDVIACDLNSMCVFHIILSYKFCALQITSYSFQEQDIEHFVPTFIGVLLPEINRKRERFFFLKKKNLTPLGAEYDICNPHH